MPVRASEGMEPYADFAPRVCQKPNTLAVYLQFYLGSILQVNQQNWKRKKHFPPLLIQNLILDSTLIFYSTKNYFYVYIILCL